KKKTVPRTPHQVRYFLFSFFFLRIRIIIMIPHASSSRRSDRRLYFSKGDALILVLYGIRLAMPRPGLLADAAFRAPNDTKVSIGLAAVRLCCLFARASSLLQQQPCKVAYRMWIDLFLSKGVWHRRGFWRTYSLFQSDTLRSGVRIQGTLQI
ncbi:hypothetical protein F5148DRAFT_1215238, partial [Russula earlei]